MRNPSIRTFTCKVLDVSLFHMKVGTANRGLNKHYTTSVDDSVHRLLNKILEVTRGKHGARLFS